MSFPSGFRDFAETGSGFFETGSSLNRSNVIDKVSGS